jgi:hypothetical protein
MEKVKLVLGVVKKTEKMMMGEGWKLKGNQWKETGGNGFYGGKDFEGGRGSDRDPGLTPVTLLRHDPPPTPPLSKFGQRRRRKDFRGSRGQYLCLPRERRFMSGHFLRAGR